jgi:hypothetical protein
MIVGAVSVADISSTFKAVCPHCHPQVRKPSLEPALAPRAFHLFGASWERGQIRLAVRMEFESQVLVGCEDFKTIELTKSLLMLFAADAGVLQLELLLL